MQQNFQSIILKQELSITNIYSIHYFEYVSDFVFEGESHNFWEFLFVDSGTVEATADAQKYQLGSGDIIFHKPNEFHAVKAINKSAPNIIVISFDCSAPCMSFFENRILRITKEEKALLSTIISEARKTFYTPLNHPYISNLRRYQNTPFGSEQLIQISLELFLLGILRRQNHSPEKQRIPPAPASHPRLDSRKTFEQITSYLSNHIYENLTVEDICRDNSISRSRLQQLFHQQEGCGVIEYFSRLKIEIAKQLIREGQYNFSQIASMLNFSSYQYFSLKFKKHTRMSPSEYLSSTKFYNHENDT